MKLYGGPVPTLPSYSWAEAHPTIMTQLSGFVVAVLLVLSSAGLIFWHVRNWNRLERDELEARELKFRRRQFRRRMQTSALLGLLGAAIFGGLLLMDSQFPWKFKAIYWIGVLLLVLWIALLAIADMVATTFYYSRARSDFVVQHAKLQAELRKARQEDSRAKTPGGHNGKPGT
jgi:hypothetical protein